MITTKQLIKIKTLMSRKKLLDYSEDMALSYSEGRTTHISELHYREALGLILYLEDPPETSPKGSELHTSKAKMQRKILSMAHEMGWKTPASGGKIDMSRVNNWCEQYGHRHKPLNLYTAAELPQLVTQFEQMYKKRLEAL